MIGIALLQFVVLGAVPADAQRAAVDSPPAAAPAGSVARIAVSRVGRLLELAYTLSDAKGARLRPHGQPPTFAVLKDGRQIGAGTFRYG